MYIDKIYTFAFKEICSYLKCNKCSYNIGILQYSVEYQVLLLLTSGVKITKQWFKNHQYTIPFLTNRNLRTTFYLIYSMRSTLILNYHHQYVYITPMIMSFSDVEYGLPKLHICIYWQKMMLPSILYTLQRIFLC